MGDRDIYEERFLLVTERIAEIERSPETEKEYREYFSETAHFLLILADICRQQETGELSFRTMEECERLNRALYEELTTNYAKSYANPAYAAAKTKSVDAGRILALLLAHFRSNIQGAFRGNKMRLTVAFELFVEIYNCFEDAEETNPLRIITDDIYSYFHDYSEIFEEEAIRRLIDPSEDFEREIVEKAELSDLRYLYRYGAYVGENEKQTAKYLNSLTEEEIQKMADTYTEGYRIGFEVTGKDLGKKKTAQIRYPIGFERMVRAAVANLRKMGLSPTMFANSVSPNKQYDYDHREDRALYLDKAYVERCLEVRRAYFEVHKEQAAEHAGPAVIEVFGEEPFAPEQKSEALRYNEKQQQLHVYEMSMYGQQVDRYLKGEERSFTIIAFPIPEIGADYEEIFRETIKINTLDYQLYRDMQQKMIDVLDEAETVHITGSGKNRTDLFVQIYPLKDRRSETAFENCVADVNIPVGEVFTTPVLKGTNGKLFVSRVYLNGLKYENLEIDFIDGKVTDYRCANFTEDAENKKYIKENILHHHDTLPMGEFAIGTNTAAYRMARKYGIADKLPILIAEKTGPHFAVGDTCYSHEEDLITRNPDGKAIVARENEISAARKEDACRAYFNCHTDITIPYDELDKVTVIRHDKTTTDIIAGGRFVLKGTEELNRPLHEEKEDYSWQK